MSKMKRNWKKYFTALALSSTLAAGTMGFSLAALGATVNTDGVNIRAEASTDSGIIGSLYTGDVVEIIESTTTDSGETWYLVRLDNGNEGYVRSDFVDDDGTTIETTEEESAQEAEEETQQDAEAGDETQAEQPAAETEVTAEETVEPEESSFVQEQEQTQTDTETAPSTQAQEPAAVGVSSGWRTAAIIFGLLLIAALALIVYLIREINAGRSRGRRRAAAPGRQDFSAQRRPGRTVQEDFTDDEEIEVEVPEEEIPLTEEADGDAYDFEEVDDLEETEDYEEADDAEDSEEVDDFEDSGDDGEYYDDLDDEEPAGRKQGGFLGFVKKILRSDEDDSYEDEDEEYEEIESDPEEEFENYEEDDYEFDDDFDEDAEYPEDVDLLPRKAPAQKEIAQDPEQEADAAVEEQPTSEDGQTKLSMDKVMRNMKAEAEEEFVSDDDPDFEDLDDEDFEEDFLDEEDDMEYSFLSKKRK